MIDNVSKIRYAAEVYADITYSKAFQDYMKTTDINKGYIFVGVGKNWYIAEKETKTFLSMGLEAKSLDATHAIHGDLGMVKFQDMIFISKSGTTKELIKLAKVVKKLRDDIKKPHFSPRLIGLFLNDDLPQDIRDIFDVVLVPTRSIGVIYEFDNRNLIPTLSILIQQMVLDTIGTTLFDNNKELSENYKYNHIGGANGKRLGMDKIFNV